MTNLNSFEKLKYERELFNSNITTVAGVDEVGRGPLAGPLVSAAVIFDKKRLFQIVQDNILSDIFSMINDSKKLSVKKRIFLDKFIKDYATNFCIFSFSPESIDQKGVGYINRKALIKAATHFNVDHILIDHFSLDLPNSTSITKGDSKSICIACASIIAKVYRDNYMTDISKIINEYQFEKNKGYGTTYHRNKIAEIGLSSIHRKSFCKKIIHYDI